MAEYTKREPIYRQSEKEAAFCPDCGTELDSLDMVNCHDQCKCGSWVERLGTPGFTNPEEKGVFFKPRVPKQEYRLKVNGVEQPNNIRYGEI